LFWLLCVLISCVSLHSFALHLGSLLLRYGQAALSDPPLRAWLNSIVLNALPEEFFPSDHRQLLAEIALPKVRTDA
jgi:hypothetical protein